MERQYSSGVPNRKPVPTSYFSADKVPTSYPSSDKGLPSPSEVVSTRRDETQLLQSVENLQLHAGLPRSPGPVYGDENAPLNLVQSPTSFSSSSTPAKEKSIWKQAFDETKHFAGGLISHPYESTKHYSILRHSHGLVFYKGPSTNVAITIFSDRPLPPDRRIWMQRKGFSGNTGMNVKAFFRSNSSWLDVTPVETAEASQLPEADERAWQRDIKKFLKKAPKELRHHTPRATAILRIPAAAADGYFRVVLCAEEGSKKVLCPSPVFRVASTSTDMSTIRGSSLATLPAEIGLKVASIVGNNAAANAIAPITDVVQSQISQYQPGFLVQEAGTAAYGATGIQGKIENVSERYDQVRDMSYDPIQSESLVEQGPRVIGNDAGPESPFPIRFDGRVVRGTGRNQADLGLPTANLGGLSEDLLLRLSGVYFGWACVLPKANLDVDADWHESIISVGPSPHAPPSIAVKKVATVHLIYDFGTKTFFDAKLKVIISGFLRPLLKYNPVTDRDRILFEMYRDISMAEASLSRPNWGPQVIIQRIKTARSERSVSDRYVDARQYTQKQIDKVPMHMAGIRTPGAELRDRAIGNGGLWVPR